MAEKIEKIETVRQIKEKLAMENIKNELSEKKRKAQSMIDRQEKATKRHFQEKKRSENNSMQLW